jgi:hypothetical protein
MPDAYALGAEFLRWEVATASAGVLLSINPFDEPNVQQAKDATRALLETYERQQRLPMPEIHAVLDAARLTLSSAAEQALSGESALAFLNVARERDYIAILAYLPPDDPSFAPILERLRHDAGARTGCATMFGYGPRYLHSTGQLHKGGPNTGVFVILVAEPDTDLPIPDQPFSFGVLEMAQALGDFQSLDRADRRALFVCASRRDPDLLRRVASALVSTA